MDVYAGSLFLGWAYVYLVCHNPWMAMLQTVRCGALRERQGTAGAWTGVGLEIYKKLASSH
ncbi:hypothetical protein MIZ03_1532 [Rhodoferax lithotrophicus]|uniref:Uncharacterized protein n=1 Tax=Rhodoferax lithotrophicus TaxID=2798804 RepID=A0ABN6D3X4_9BURK|nr:hypothetical protein MIZ03_1532 [Rhodoferax sp. MIZ03]